MIKVANLKKSFEDQIVLNGINLEVGENQIFSIMGESGTGKSVFLKLIMGFLQPDEGRIFIDDTEITSMHEKDLLHIRKDIGYLFQESALFDFMTVYDNLAFQLRENTNFSEKEIEKKVRISLERVHLKDIEDKFPAELSGGMKKRIGIARAIIMEPKIFLCDEPTSGLDPSKALSIMNLISEIVRSFKATCIIASHDVENVFKFSDIVAILYKGKLIAEGKKEDILRTELKAVKEFLLLDN